MSESRIEIEAKVKAEIARGKKRFFKYFFFLMVHFGLIILTAKLGFPLLARFLLYAWAIIFLYFYFFVAVPHVLKSYKLAKKARYW